MEKRAESTCPRCGQPFTCSAIAIHICDCSKLQLTAVELGTIRTYTERTLGTYTCLCTNCLRELVSDDTLSTHLPNPPIPN